MNLTYTKEGLQIYTALVYLVSVFALGANVCAALSASDNPAPLCSLKFASEDVLHAEIMIQNDWRSRQKYPCENGQLKLPAGTYLIENIEFKSGVSIIYKNKIVELIPGQETLVTFKLPENSNLEVHRQGIYVAAEYTPKGYWDEEFYSNRTSPPVFKIYHNRRLVHTAVSEYG